MVKRTVLPTLFKTTPELTCQIEGLFHVELEREFIP